MRNLPQTEYTLCSARAAACARRDHDRRLRVATLRLLRPPSPATPARLGVAVRVNLALRAKFRLEVFLLLDGAGDDGRANRSADRRAAHESRGAAIPRRAPAQVAPRARARGTFASDPKSSGGRRRGLSQRFCRARRPAAAPPDLPPEPEPGAGAAAAATLLLVVRRLSGRRHPSRGGGRARLLRSSALRGVYAPLGALARGAHVPDVPAARAHAVARVHGAADPAAADAVPRRPAQGGARGLGRQADPKPRRPRGRPAVLHVLGRRHPHRLLDRRLRECVPPRVLRAAAQTRAARRGTAAPAARLPPPAPGTPPTPAAAAGTAAP